jgi:hypothetical protein
MKSRSCYAVFRVIIPRIKDQLCGLILSTQNYEFFVGLANLIEYYICGFIAAYRLMQSKGYASLCSRP